MRTLVTGGAGFIGSHVARHCLELGHEVVVLDDLSGGFEDQVPEGASFVQGSVSDERLVNRLFDSYQFNYVYHLAAYAAEGLSHFIRRFNYTNNLLGSVTLINAAVNHKIQCFVFTSSIAVYGSNQLPMKEDMTPQPEDPYGISKYAVELDLRAAHELYGLNYIVFRPHNVYGEHQNIGDRYRNVVGIFMKQIMQGQPMTIFGDGTQTRAFSYIGDVAPIIAASVYNTAAYNQAINIGATAHYSANTLARVVADAFNVAPEIEYLPARKEVLHAYADHSKAQRLFSPSEPIGLVDGVARMAAWARIAGCRESKYFEDIEVTRELPMSWRRELARA
ncbi:MAG TPA: NAD-dependent epimerase/dehydratase family protein [Bryobacteraceae bacterium]